MPLNRASNHRGLGGLLLLDEPGMDFLQCDKQLRVSGGLLTYSTPENPDGAQIAVERFAGRGGLSFTGTYEDADFEMTVTPLECSDGMSDRIYPFTITLKMGDDLREGCGWSDRQPFAGPERP